jgi:N6-adenosine-specific RNA methylase IME4
MTLYLSHPVRVLVADPPWMFRDGLPTTKSGAGRGAGAHYQCLTLEQIKTFALPTLARPSVLLLWRVASMQEEALAVVRAWGFVPKSEIVWRKQRAKGGRAFGMGHYVRAEHEVCIVAARGPAASLVKRRNVRSTFDAPVGRHSEKPDAFYALVEQLFDGPYAELFARRKRTGWDVYGNEVAA